MTASKIKDRCDEKTRNLDSCMHTNKRAHIYTISWPQILSKSSLQLLFHSKTTGKTLWYINTFCGHTVHKSPLTLPTTILSWSMPDMVKSTSLFKNLRLFPHYSIGPYIASVPLSTLLWFIRDIPFQNNSGNRNYSRWRVNCYVQHKQIKKDIKIFKQTSF
jgi:hypothetical protein